MLLIKLLNAVDQIAQFLDFPICSAFVVVVIIMIRNDTIFFLNINIYAQDHIDVSCQQRYRSYFSGCSWECCMLVILVVHRCSVLVWVPIFPVSKIPVAKILAPNFSLVMCCE